MEDPPWAAARNGSSDVSVFQGANATSEQMAMHRPNVIMCKLDGNSLGKEEAVRWCG